MFLCQFASQKVPKLHPAMLCFINNQIWAPTRMSLAVLSLHLQLLHRSTGNNLRQLSACKALHNEAPTHSTLAEQQHRPDRTVRKTLCLRPACTAEGDVSSTVTAEQTQKAERSLIEHVPMNLPVGEMTVRE